MEGVGRYSDSGATCVVVGSINHMAVTVSCFLIVCGSVLTQFVVVLVVARL